ncbi:MAG: HAD-IIB family hydrolase [Trueperaceae bacterium]|nr:MAG: HAD-IIB family hydrolase [Trueperaceae bacterium]
MPETPRNVVTDDEHDATRDDEHDAARDDAPGLYIQMFSLHGLIRGRDLELGRDADTGGQTKYVVELAVALGERPEVAQVDLFTRRIDDPRISDDYDVPIEPLSEHARIVRLRCGGGRYRRKELLWPSLDAFVDEVLRFNREQERWPDLVHGHYADAGYVARHLSSYLNVPLVFTGHSLGRNKLRVLKGAGVDEAAIDERYHIHHRIGVEESLLRDADLVIASTTHEVERGYELYDESKDATFEVIAPGVDVERFYPYYHDLDEGHDPGEDIRRARVRMREEIARFLNRPEKPLILAISRPDKRKNIEGLVTAYGEDKELQSIANLAIFAGVRKDIRDMSDNESEVLTELLLLMDRYDLYGKLALPKKHDPDTDIPVLYRLAAASGGVFINPALVENFGITLIESSSVGLPVVSTGHGGPQDIIGACQSGVLIDARDGEQIRRELKRVLVDREAWEAYSRNGVEGVRKHYAWTAHAERYLEVIAPLLSSSQESLAAAPWRSGIARTLRDAKRLLVSDIDHTLIKDDDDDTSGDPDALGRLGEALAAADVAFAVASGRSLELVEAALDSHDLPSPSIVISSVGSEIHYAGGDPAERHWIPDRGYARHLEHNWDRDAVRAALAEVEGLRPQDDEAQRRFKLSYYLGDADGVERVKEALKRADLRASVIYSHEAFLDVLPVRASKGKAVRYLSQKWGYAPQQIAVAGDSGNDEEMLRGPFRAIIVGNYAPELEHLKGKRGVYTADAAYAAGVIEGLRHWSFIPRGDG